MTSRPSLLFYCQHAMGMGHLVRSLALAETLSDSFQVVLLNGGEMPREVRLPKRIEIINLPPLGLDHGQLVTRDPRYTVEQARQARTQIILRAFKTAQPDVLLMELFPFGRKKFEFELLPLLDEAHGRGVARPLVACSLRDILVSTRRDQERHEEHALAIANRYVDLILVHSDPGFARFEESRNSHTLLMPSVHHTGFVVSERPAQQPARLKTGPIVVSAGGGLYGYQLLSTVINAHAWLSQSVNVAIKLIAGPFLPDDEWDALCAAVSDRDNLTLVRAVPDLYEELRNARASISQCGYNTALEVLQAGVPALVVPFADGGEDEQMTRARRLERLGAIRLLDQKEMSAARMAHEIKGLLNYHPGKVALNFAGARRSAEILTDQLNRRRLSETSQRTNERLECQL